MGFEMKANAVNQIPKGTEIFLENETVSYVCVVIRGCVLARSESVKLSLPSGSFLGVFDLSVGHYVSDYIAAEDSMLYVFPVHNKQLLRELLTSTNKDYRGLIVNSLTKYFYELSKINREFHKMAEEIYPLLTDAYAKYKGFCREAGEGVVLLPVLERIEAYQRDTLVNQQDFPYYQDLAKVPADVQKSFFGCGIELTMTHVDKLSVIISGLLSDTRDVCAYVKEYVTCLYNDGSQNLLMNLMQLSYVIGKKSRPVAGVQALLDKLLEDFNRMEELMECYMGMPPVVKRERLEKMYTAVLIGEDMEEANESASDTSDEELYQKLRNTLQQLIDFSEVPKGQLGTFTDAMNTFVRAKDRMSAEDEFRSLRRQIADGFYALYRAVFLKSLKEENNLPKAAELFLNYGFTDERLLTKEQVLELCHLDVSTKNNYHCTMFTIPEWLRAVYTGKRQPSKNEFDMEYVEMLREQKKTGEISAEEEKKLAGDPMKKLEYEMQNMFRYNHRVVNGQPSVFVPVLCSEQMMSGPARAAITKDRMGQMVEKYREIDFSVFYRELSYADAASGIEKEQIMKEVIPDIILFPAYGQNASMWQELSCKRRDSAGRFLFPIMAEGNIDDLIIRTFGRFRWELCRTMQGSSWNNIQYKSLTSEYADYIQFYKKNKDLSEERKEKIKQQIMKGKNSTREIFVQDYELWIKSEALGAMRLNKVSREILSMYCPFNKEIRNAVETQPAFADPIARFKRERMKKVRELELRYHAYTSKQGISLTQDLVNNLVFYRDK
ncbi:MAG: hypothetical protein IKL28_05485 [Lachnospiraceae bacterium]|nr:hypothetical protein [Lachnospiraceae bacterium]